MKNLVLGLIAVMTLSVGAASAQKIAIIDSRTVLAAMPEALDANTKLEATKKMWQDSLQTMETVFQAKLDTYQKMGDNVTADYKKKSEEELNNLRQGALMFQQQKFGQQGELAMMQQQLVQPIMDKLRTAIEAYGKKEKYTMILDRTAAIYVDGSVDVTSKFQDYLKSTASAK